MSDIKIDDIVKFRHDFTGRKYVVFKIIDNWECMIREYMSPPHSGTKWRLDAVEKITKEEYPEYFI